MRALPACVSPTAVNTVRVTALGDFPALPGLTASASAMQNAILPLPRQTRVVDVQGFGPVGLAAFGHTAPLQLDKVGDSAIALAYGPPDGICATAQLNDARASPTVTLLASGAALVSGGHDGDKPVTSLELYLPAGDAASPLARFRVVPSMGLAPEAVLGHAVATLSDGGALISGGVGVAASPPYGEHGIAYPGALRLAADGTLIGAAKLMLGGSRAEHTATTLPDGRVLLAGGCADLEDGGCRMGEVLGSTVLYNPVADAFSQGPKLVYPRFGHHAVLRGDGTVLLVGGVGEGGVVVRAEIVDPGEMRGFDAGPSTGAAVGLPGGGVLVAGAPASPSGHVGLWLSPSGEAELPLANVPSEGVGPPLLAALDDGGVLIVPSPSPSQAYVFDGRETVAPLAAPLPFDPGAMARLADGTVLFVGGRSVASQSAAIYFRSPLSPFVSLPPLTLEGPSDPYLPRRPDRAVAAGGQLLVSTIDRIVDGRPAELALVAAMQVADFDFDLLAGRRGTATAALLAGWQSEASYVFLALAPGQPVALSTVSSPRSGATMAASVPSCNGAVISASDLPDGTLAPFHLAWRNGTLTLTATGRTLLSCRPPSPLARGLVGVGSIVGTAAFGSLLLSR
jgi:hypothetical protein